MFEPGDAVCCEAVDADGISGTAKAGSVNYRLQSTIHKGPRSTVWKATAEPSGVPVVIKVLETPTADKRNEALQELSLMQQVSGWWNNTPLAGASGDNHVQQTAGSSAGSCLQPLVRMLRSIMIEEQHIRPANQQQRRQHKHHKKQHAAALAEVTNRQWADAESKQPRVFRARCSNRADNSCIATDSTAVTCGTVPGAAGPAGPTAPAGDAVLAAVAVVLEPLHQSLSWVLHFLWHRTGQSGLPPPAVRSLAYQLLSGLAELHDTHALVHRDIKPSNLLLRHPLVVRKTKGKIGTTSLAELSTAQWTVIDLGSAAMLSPPAAVSAATGDQSRVVSKGHNRSLLHAWPSWNWNASSSRSSSSVAQPVQPATVLKTPSTQHWCVADGASSPYETPAYTPPEAMLQLPATAAHDIWAAACCMYEAATGTILFPVEDIAKARGLSLSKPAISRCLHDDTAGLEIDKLHLAVIKSVCGRPPVQLLKRSPAAADLFGNKWLQEAEDAKNRQDYDADKRWWQLLTGGSSGNGKASSSDVVGGNTNRVLLHRLTVAAGLSHSEAVELCEFLQPMLAWDPLQRPTAAELLGHSYFKPLQLKQ